MGSAGLEWDSNDQPEQARLNQKTTFVGTGAQINALSTTYAGQLAYCTSTGSGFTVDTLYVRNAANSAWNDVHLITDNITETSEQNTTPVTDDSELTPVAQTRYYAYFTLPTTEPLYMITGIEWENGTAVAGNVTCGVDVVDANPPTLDSTPLVAYGIEIAQAGTSAVQRNSDIMSNPIRGGTILGAWVAFSSTSARPRIETGASSAKYTRATVAADNQTPTALENTSFANSTDRIHLKVYYMGYY